MCLPKHLGPLILDLGWTGLSEAWEIGKAHPTLGVRQWEEGGLDLIELSFAQVKTQIDNQEMAKL